MANLREPHTAESPLTGATVSIAAAARAGEADAHAPDALSERDATIVLSERDAAIVLSERDKTILAFERQWWRHAGAKEQGIRAEFGLSAARYYQLLGALIDSPQALAHDPMLVKRLQRMREARAEARARRSISVP